MTSKTGQAFAVLNSVAPTPKGEKNSGLENVQTFLQRFGYIEGDAAHPGELDDQTSVALEKYQSVNGLQPTGAFDEATRDQMTTHRCGLPDLISGIEFTALCSWNKLQLTYAFDTGTNDIGGSGEFQAVRNAFATWMTVSPLTFTEVALNQNPDIRIGWRPANDPDLSMVGGVLAHADFPPGCSVVTNTLPKPVHFDDSEHTWANGALPGTFDVETVALHEIGHILGLAHSSVTGSVMFASVSSNFTKRALTADDIAGIQSLYPNPSVPMALKQGVYTIRQKSNNRFMDAHESSANDFSVVTRTAQNNDTQRWIIRPVGGIYTIQQKSNNRFIDAHESATNDFSVVTRTTQNNDTQRWILWYLGNNTYTIQQKSNNRFVDAHESSTNDFSVVTRPAQNNDTQRWVLNRIGSSNVYTIQQKSNNRFMDAHENSANDFSVVTRPAQNNDTQRWVLQPLEVWYTIQQRSSGRFMDAHDTSANDFSVVTRTVQNNDTQRWIIKPLGNNTYTIQQKSNNRFADAHETSANDFSVVTRTAQNNDTQRWIINLA